MNKLLPALVTACCLTLSWRLLADDLADPPGVPGNIVEFAQLGFVAATINYRVSKEAPFPAAQEDCKAANRWLRAHA